MEDNRYGTEKYGDRLWNDFLTACNKFFDARNEANAGTRNEETANLEKKREIVENSRDCSKKSRKDFKKPFRSSWMNTEKWATFHTKRRITYIMSTTKYSENL